MVKVFNKDTGEIKEVEIDYNITIDEAWLDVNFIPIWKNKKYIGFINPQNGIGIIER